MNVLKYSVQDIARMMDAGIISRAEARDMLNLPDGKVAYEMMNQNVQPTTGGN